MRLLLITTDTNPDRTLAGLYTKHDIKTASADDIDTVEADSYDVCIVYGGYGAADIKPGQYGLLMTFISAGTKPLLAVGFGFELVCRAFGADLAQLGELETGTVRILPTDDGAKLFQGSDPLCVKETRRWSVDELPKKLAILAKSETGIEAIRHKTLSIYALQQLPEDFVYASDAKMVFENLLAAYKIK